eukprot:gnl/TRDRNA2_/TRDRNA2_204078_c0_seq1.p1 gnl/TRDRNA2_/TRDRNA2_204078_c0~~gnl/TRDRNA2_/TRDRNA2_204078_c0_seq1.p1  ORF type:complete len:188 (-),score=20.94 gnl/TRDRNA2_/TRDRNA2_204078_c0_seq1:311-874(-)
MMNQQAFALTVVGINGDTLLTRQVEPTIRVLHVMQMICDEHVASKPCALVLGDMRLPPQTALAELNIQNQNVLLTAIYEDAWSLEARAASLAAVVGQWQDTRGSRYEVSISVPGESLDVSTIRPNGMQTMTRKLIRLKSGTLHVLWGKGDFQWVAVEGQPNLVRWCSQSGGRDFEWLRDEAHLPEPG